jgi:hypothetical protein
MLRKIAAGLLATALIAGPAFAAQPQGEAGTPPAAAAVHQKIASVHKIKHLRKHTSRHFRVHFVRGKTGTVKLAHHTKTAKPLRSHAAKTARHLKTAKLPNGSSVSR